MRNILKLTFVLYNTARGYYELVPHRLGAAVHQTDIDVNGMVESLERAQASRLAHLDSLQHRLSSCQQDREDLQQACAEVDQKAGEKSNFRKLLAELSESGAELERAVAREAELFTPQQYEATFERRLFRNTLGLDIRLTQDRLISLVFTNVCPEQPDKQFRATLDVSDTGHWEVVNLDPHVHGVQDLMGALNRPGGSITQFCRAFRQHCKQYSLQQQ